MPTKFRSQYKFFEKVESELTSGLNLIGSLTKQLNKMF